MAKNRCCQAIHFTSVTEIMNSVHNIDYQREVMVLSR